MPSNTLSPLLSGTSGTTTGELADRLGIAARPAEMLLTGCAALGLLQSQDGRHVDSPLSDEYLVPGKPNHFGGLVTMFDRRLHARLGQAHPGHPDRSADHVGPRP